jgi:hypothetical protein
VTSPRLQRLLELEPLLHHDSAGEAVSWRLSDEALQFIDRNVPDGARTVETGEGMSTVLLATKRCRHTVVSPNQVVFMAIREFCEREGIELDTVEFVEDFSQRALPRLELENLEFALIDGGHGFPTPFMDWFYVSLSLGAGGIVLVDDTQIWTGAVLREFLLEEPDWKSVADWPGRACAFEKLTDTQPFSEWTEQPFVIQKMAAMQRGARPGGLGATARRAFGALRGARGH